jgi:hypothetical protein
MFDSIIKRIEKYEEVFVFQNLLLLLIRVKVGISKAMDIFSDEGVNEERLKQKKDFEHFGNPLQPQALLV